MITWEQRRGQIKHLLYELCLTGRIDRATFCEQIADLNNVTPVVRCKNCKWYSQVTSMTGKLLPEGRCEYHSNYFAEDDFCSRGERKNG
jgi:hypothetical protein